MSYQSDPEVDYIEDQEYPGEPANKAFPVHIASADVPFHREAVAEFASCMTWPIGIAGVNQPTQILTRRYHRKTGRIFIPSMGGTVQGNNAFGGGSAAAPAAGTTIGAASPALAAGTYTVKWSVVLLGALAAADEGNIAIFLNGVQVSQAAINGVNAGTIEAQPDIQISVPAGGILTARAINNATAGTTYQASFSAIQTLATSITSLVLNSRQEALMQAVPQGLTFATAPHEFLWESQQPCYAIAVGTGAPNILVIDEAYAGE